MTTLTLVNAGSALVPSTSTAAGAMIDNVREECGFAIRMIDWMCRQIGFDLIGAIFNPIAGNFSGVDQVRLNLASLGATMTGVGDNYSRMAANVPSVWTGSAATAAQESLSELAAAHAQQGEGLGMMSRQVGNMLTATEEIVKLIATIIGTLADELLSIGVVKFLELIVAGWAKIQRYVRLIERAIDLVRSLSDLIPALVSAAKALGTMLTAMKAVMMATAVGSHMRAGGLIDETAATL